MAKDYAQMEDSNRSLNPSIHEVSDRTRRIFVSGGFAATVAGLLGPMAVGSLTGCAIAPRGSGGANAASLGRGISFKSIPMAAIDSVAVPEGYSAQVLYRWGDPVGVAGQMPAFRLDASNSAADQALQAGMHHDGMAFFPLDNSSGHGLLVVNHEYVDDGLLHPDGMKTWTADKVRKSMAAHGVSVIEIQREGNAWTQVVPSKFARRVTALTPMIVTGPAAGHAMLKTAADPSGTRVLGTFNNCSNGHTPWGTYLTCEENFADYFEGVDNPDSHQRRWGMRKGNGQKYRWHEHEERFEVAKHPNEANRFGWVVEIDPQDPSSTPVKRSALGRAAHEGAATALTADGRAVIYMGGIRASSTSTSSSAATASSLAGLRPTVNCWTTARCTSRALTSMAPANGCRSRRAPVRSPPTRALRARATYSSRHARPAMRWVPPRWIGLSGRPSTRSPKRSTAR